MREEPSIPRVLLQAWVRDEYGLTPASIEFLLVGRDMNAGVYRVSSLDGTSCLLKVKSGGVLRGELYGPAVPLRPRHHVPSWRRCRQEQTSCVRGPESGLWFCIP